MVAILEKTEHNTDFHQIVDFLEASHIRYALTISPTIYVSHIRHFWSTARIETTDQETKIIATVDGKPRTISESSLRRHLKINDEEGISSLPDAELFENFSLMGYNEPASLSRDDRHGEAFPTVSSLDAGQDRENIAKTSAMPYESSPRVPSLDDDKGRDGNVLSSMDAANILSSEGAAFSTASVSPADVFPTAGVHTVSGSFPLLVQFLPLPVRAKENETQEQIDAHVAREMEEEFARENQRLSEQVSRDSEIARIHAEEELKLMIEEKIELISELVKYQDHRAEILKYQAQQSKPSSKKEQRKFYMSVLKSHARWKTKNFKGMTLEQIKEKFIPVWKHMQDFVPMSLKEESEKVKRPGIKLDQGSSKMVKILHTSRSKPSQEQQFKGSKGVSEDELNGMIQLVPLEEVNIKALQVKHPIIDWEIHTEEKREYWKIIRLGGDIYVSR
nr:hypothetical protein [Tanacetum cinerariifolium]